jgi:hypothetical protein
VWVPRPDEPTLETQVLAVGPDGVTVATRVRGSNAEPGTSSQTFFRGTPFLLANGHQAVWNWDDPTSWRDVEGDQRSNWGPPPAAGPSREELRAIVTGTPVAAPVDVAQAPASIDKAELRARAAYSLASLRTESGIPAAALPAPTPTQDGGMSKLSSWLRSKGLPTTVPSALTFGVQIPGVSAPRPPSTPGPIQPTAPPLPSTGWSMPPGTGPGTGGTAIDRITHPVETIRGWLQGGGTQQLQQGQRQSRLQPGPNGACPVGWHLNKSWLSDGRGGRIPPRSVCVRNRSTNPLNSKALRRAVSRLTRGEKLVKRMFLVTEHKRVSVKPKKGGRK